MVHMNKYRVRIVMRDGSAGVHHGLYPDGCSAIICALELFPAAKCISAWRMSVGASGLGAPVVDADIVREA